MSSEISNAPEAWVFVSHSSADLLFVRKVRNALEEMGASPLLFHLRGLKRPKHFWPVIKREIEHRNFFLYCESEAAENSEWVRRERSFVDSISRRRPIRIGSISTSSLDIAAGLEDFMRKARVFALYDERDAAKVAVHSSVLRDADFQIFELAQGDDPEDGISIDRAVLRDLGADRGHLVAFISPASWMPRGPQPSKIKSVMNYAAWAGVTITPVLLGDVDPSVEPLSKFKCIDGRANPRSAALELKRRLLSE